MSDLWLRRIAWGLATLGLIIIVSAIVLLLRAPANASIARLANLSAGFVALGAPILGVIIVRKQPHNRIAWLWIFYGLTVGMRALGHAIYYASGAQSVGYSNLELFFLWSTELGNLSVLLCYILLLLWFPDGHLPSHRWRFLYVWMLGAFTVLSTSLFIPGSDWNGGAAAGGIVIDNPYGWISVSPDNPIQNLGLPAFLSIVLILFLSAISLIFRYRAADRLVRLQLRWFVLGSFGFFLMTFGPVLMDILMQSNRPHIESGIDVLLLFVQQASIVPLYVATAIAILRYRLYDIDLVIRKTLQYGVLTAILVTLYFGFVVLMQTLFGRATGEQSPIIIVISTLTIAALFNPLRRQIQTWVDRRFFRQTYDAQQVLARFATLARDETDPDAIVLSLTTLVQETMLPKILSVWTREGVDLIAMKSEAPGSDDSTVP